MNRKLQALVAAAMFAGASAGAIGAAQAQDAAEDLIKSRQSVMRIFASSLTGLGNIAQGKVSQPGHLTNYATSLASVSAILPDLFPEGTGADSGTKTRALAAIWEDPADFQQVIATTQAAADALLAAAESGDPAAVGAALGDLGKNGCGACHTKYRQPQ